MIHDERVIELDGGYALSLGYTMCFSAPAVAATLVRRPPDDGRVRGADVVASLSLSREQLDALIAALEQVRASMPRGDEP